jgi:hypothetical protein
MNITFLALDRHGHSCTPYRLACGFQSNHGAASPRSLVSISKNNKKTITKILILLRSFLRVDHHHDARQAQANEFNAPRAE